MKNFNNFKSSPVFNLYGFEFIDRKNADIFYRAQYSTVKGLELIKLTLTPPSPEESKEKQEQWIRDYIAKEDAILSTMSDLPDEERGEAHKRFFSEEPIELPFERILIKGDAAWNIFRENAQFEAILKYLRLYVFPLDPLTAEARARQDKKYNNVKRLWEEFFATPKDREEVEDEMMQLVAEEFRYMEDPHIRNEMFSLFDKAIYGLPPESGGVRRRIRENFINRLLPNADFYQVTSKPIYFQEVKILMQELAKYLSKICKSELKRRQIHSKVRGGGISEEAYKILHEWSLINEPRLSGFNSDQLSLLVFQPLSFVNKTLSEYFGKSTTTIRKKLAK